jgi:hypothetical protein
MEPTTAIGVECACRRWRTVAHRATLGAVHGRQPVAAEVRVVARRVAGVRTQNPRRGADAQQAGMNMAAMPAAEPIALMVACDCWFFMFCTDMLFWNIWFWMLDAFMIPLLAPPYDWLPRFAHDIGEPVIELAVLIEFWRMPEATLPIDDAVL